MRVDTCAQGMGVGVWRCDADMRRGEAHVGHATAMRWGWGQSERTVPRRRGKGGEHCSPALPSNKSMNAHNTSFAGHIADEIQFGGAMCGRLPTKPETKNLGLVLPRGGRHRERTD